jgi:Ca2+-transporting ATPase
VVIVVTVTATNDYFKERQFAALNAQSKNIQFDVLRGGKTIKISVYDIVVGDICYVQVGYLSSPSIKLSLNFIVP